MVEYGVELGPCVGSQHCYTGFSEVGYPFEQRLFRQEAANLEKAAMLVDVGYTFGNLSA